jgi:2'-5' RNA ligase
VPPPSYHLWVKPEGAAYEVLARTIRDLARELAAPVFDPHVTLLGHLEQADDHSRLATDLAARLRRWLVVLTEPAYRHEYFQCLFMRVDQTADVMGSHAMAAKIFNRPDDEPYAPHVSLLYGSFPESRKRKIVERLPPAVRTSFTVTRLYLIEARSDDPKDWREIAGFPLGLDG